MSQEGDLVLIHYDDKPTIYARIEAIEPDVKKDWYQVTLLLLTIPAQSVTWILREAYINGAPFTMGGHPMRLGEVQWVSPTGKPEETSQPSQPKGKAKPGKVIPLKNQS